jgi:hypothetical protein
MCLDRRKAKRTQQQQHGLIADLGGLAWAELHFTFLYCLPGLPAGTVLLLVKIRYEGTQRLKVLQLQLLYKHCILYCIVL